MNEEVKAMRCEITKRDRVWVINYKSQDEQTAIFAIMTKTDSGCQAALYKVGDPKPSVTVETTFGMGLSFVVVRHAIKGLMSKLGKGQRWRANRAARKAAEAAEGCEVAELRGCEEAVTRDA